MKNYCVKPFYVLNISYVYLLTDLIKCIELMPSFQGRGGPHLTDILAFKVCGRLNKKHDIRNMFLFLRVEGHKIDAIFQNNINDREELVYQLMTEWRKRMKSPEEGYTTLWKALTDQEVNLASIAHEVLKEPPTDKITTKSPDKGKLSTITHYKCKP